MALAPGKEISLFEPPTDGISSIKFSNYVTPLLVAASWDTYVRIYDTASNTVKAKYQHKAPVLDATFIDEKRVASAGLDHAVKIYDMVTGRETVLGAHSAPVRCVEYSDEHSAVVTGSWDSSVRLWDPRKPGAEAMKLAAPAKVLTMALLEGKSVLIAGTADRHIQFFDLRAGTATKKRESTLKHQTRFIRAFPDETGYIIGSIEGRCGVEFVEDGDHASKKYAFKCHRTPDPAHPGEDRIFPVNACAFHPVYGTFATGGGDGTVLMWDYKAKKRLCRVRECETSVSSLAFNSDGKKLAIAVSYTWEQGERSHPADAIVIKDLADESVRCK